MAASSRNAQLTPSRSPSPSPAPLLLPRPTTSVISWSGSAVLPPCGLCCTTRPANWPPASTVCVVTLVNPAALRICLAWLAVWPSTVGTAEGWLPFDTFIVTFEPGCDCVPAGGSVDSTVSFCPPPSTVLVSTSKPLASRAFLAVSLSCPVTSGTATPVACTPTARSTELPPLTRTPGPGLELTTLPTCVASLVCWLLCLPTSRPWLFSSAVASATLMPVSAGTLTNAGPEPTVRSTVERSATCVPWVGLVLRTFPTWSTDDSCCATLPTRRPAAMSWLDASCWVWPTTPGTATCDGV